MAGNQFWGDIPPEYCTFANLSQFHVSSNNLGPCYDSQLSCFCSGPANWDVRISNNNFYPIPFSVFCASGDGDCSDNCIDLDGVDDFLGYAEFSTSGDFSNQSYDYLKKKIEYFKLDNIRLIKGNFEKTVPNFFNSNKIKISSCNIDCDLYEGYKIILPYIYNNLSKGGYIFLDEYYSLKFPGAKIATDNFCKNFKIKPKRNLVRKGEFERWYITK